MPNITSYTKQAISIFLLRKYFFAKLELWHYITLNPEELSISIHIHLNWELSWDLKGAMKTIISH
ncbi:hypothetical protein SPHINGO8BC_10074 [Sphingobacterium multivorum]|uniref:Uncharacterized protein n=1 Tax=Sphingobacterium multivorum TaxID=28454 RepID=A0A653XMP5_SPHMU|nr:hypothetical protein SPHINGO8BC_10074 [Sphingobacterium multivorum]